MNKKLLTGLAAVGLLAGGGSATALAAAAPAAAASSAAVASSTSKAPYCGPLEPLIAKGTITRAQAISIHNAFVSYFHANWRHILDTVIGKEVTNHTITPAQGREVTNAITRWTQSHQSGASSHHAVCHPSHGGGMTGGSGSR
jgi:hypothetical protein